MFLKSNILKAVSFTKSTKLPSYYWLLVSIRFALVCLPQTGYIHPDEFFQNIEVIAGDIFTIDVAKTWEFNPQFPIRNIFIPKVAVGLPLHFIRVAHPYAKYYLNIDLKTPYFLLVIPRLFICLLSLLSDYCLYKISVIYGQNFKVRLITFATSYVVLVFSTRTFSNTFEMIFFSALLLLVVESMVKTDKVVYHSEYLLDKYKHATTAVEKVNIFKLQSQLPDHNLHNVFFISNLVVVGIFNRPTFIGFAFPPVFFWLQRGLGSKVIGFKHFNIRIFALFITGLPAVFLLVLIDSGYYGYMTMADIESMKISWDNWVVTPLNFLRYNLDVKNLKDHGLHSKWLHLTVNVPILFNILGMSALINVVLLLIRLGYGDFRKLPRFQSIRGLMLFSLIFPVFLLSLFPHQEARFIIPVLVPLVYLDSNNLYANEADSMVVKRKKQIRLGVWFLINILSTLFFGFIHQGGIYPLANSLYYDIKNSYGVHTHVLTSHSYSIPTFFLQLESTTKIWRDKNTGQKYRLAPATFINSFGSIPPEELLANVDAALTEAERRLATNKKRYKIYVVTPCTLVPDILEESRKYHYFELREEFTYYPHHTTESLPVFPAPNDRDCIYHNNMPKNESHMLDMTLQQRIMCFLRQFCLKVFIVKEKHYKI